MLLGNVAHPFLVGMHYSFQTESKLYFVLDYVNGGAFLQYCLSFLILILGELFFHLQREKKFDVARSKFYAAQITSALGYLHGLNIVYRY